MSSDLETAIDTIATAMGATAYTVKLSEHEAAARVVPPRVAWTFVENGEPSFPEQQEDPSDTVGFTVARECQVELWGAGVSGSSTDDEVTWALYKAFVAACANGIGEMVVEIGKARAVRGAKHVAKGTAVSMPVRIKFPVLVEDLATHTVLTTALAASVTDLDGTNPEAAP